MLICVDTMSMLNVVGFRRGMNLLSQYKGLLFEL
jgi:hypothetical protein